MSNVLLMVSTKESSLFKCFCVAVSDAIFALVPGSREEVIKHLKYLGMSPESISRASRKYFHQRQGYVIPYLPPFCGVHRKIYCFFKDVIDPFTRRFVREMKYVKTGHLSDVPGLSAYIIVGYFKSGLARYVDLRSSSQQEGCHLHMRLVRSCV